MSSQFMPPNRQHAVPSSQMIHHPQPAVRPNLPSMGGLNGGGSNVSVPVAAAVESNSSSGDDSGLLDKFLNTSTTTKIIIIGSIVALVAVGYFAYKRYQDYQMQQQFHTGLMHCMEMGPTPEMLANMQQHGYTGDVHHPPSNMTCEGDKCYPTPVEPQLATIQTESAETTEQPEQPNTSS